MTNQIIEKIRAVSVNLKNAIFGGVVLDRASGTVTVRLITDEAFTPADKTGAERVLRTYVPESFKCRVDISKLTPDEEMVAKKIMEAVCVCSKAVFAKAI